MAAGLRRIGFLGAAMTSIALVTLAGCSSGRSRAAIEARTRFVGMPVDEFLICMGPPVAKTRESGIDFLIYKSAARVTNTSAPSGLGRMSSTVVSECTANVAVRAGKVAAITYTGDVHEMGDEYGPCYEIVASCLKK